MANPQESNKEQDFPKFCGADIAKMERLLQKLEEYLQNIFQVFDLGCAGGATIPAARLG